MRIKKEKNGLNPISLILGIIENGRRKSIEMIEMLIYAGAVRCSGIFSRSSEKCPNAIEVTTKNAIFRPTNSLLSMADGMKIFFIGEESFC